MELPGFSYLYTIITASITYAGFAALIVIFRQVIWRCFELRYLSNSHGPDEKFYCHYLRNDATGIGALRFVSLSHLAHI